MNISQEVLRQRISSLVSSRNKSKISNDEESGNNNRRRKNSNNKKIENVITLDSSDSDDNKISISITENKPSNTDKPKRFSFSYPKTDNKIVISDDDDKTNDTTLSKEEEHEEENYIGFESSDNSEEESDKKKEEEEEEEDNKRKRKRNYEVHSRDILTPISIPPWIQPKKKYSEFAPEMLHEEIIDFVKYISPTPEEKYMREYALNRIKNVILDLWPGSVVEAYGSYKTNLYLPTSDIDIVILNEDLFVPSCFFDLQDALQEADIVSKIEVIDKARIPIIKLVEKVTGYHFDISANAESGINSANLMEKFIETTGYGEAIRALVLVIKQFLAQRYMNEVYSGGLGSYSVFILVTNFIMMHPCVQNKHMLPQENLGVLLLEFLELFGRVFNYEEVGLGISLKKGAFYFRKEDKNWYNYNRPRLLSLQDPDDENNDVGKNSFAVSKILQAFDQAFATVSGKMCAQFSRIQPGYKKELEHERQRHKKRKHSDSSRHRRFNDDDDDDDNDTFNFVEPYIRQCKSFLGSIIWINKETQLHRQRIKEIYEELH
ncbi:Nucleotidyltransferase [Anaeromyces robustus]|uniref:polynucleotide adenylyltransferase n=1 Tax=Anaeromyces robustus TaxID=1754192 RepID=A0A1Y1XNR3_9FUNG|nr:Nucleotidyltransferase [Anaeromyces robustus]|eukprot:ORX87373.1 Nucleotidyltransferase [Anaeromyces robustus]